MLPTAIRRVYAMGRPRRPVTERDAVRAAVVGQSGTAAQRARRPAAAVAELALRDVDGAPGERIVLLLRALDVTPAALLATDPDIDTAALIRTERMRRMEARAWRRLPECEWAREDCEIAVAIAATLAKRYARHLGRMSS